jgi:acetylglutamate kinase
VTAPVRVIKVGGNRADDAVWMCAVARAAAAAGTPAVVVHGGGREVTRLQRALGSEPAWRDGLRMTTPEGMEVVRMVLSGTMNKRWVGALLDAGLDAVGISGEDGGLLAARFTAAGPAVRTGAVDRVRGELLLRLLAGGLTPVVSPVSRGPDGGAVNVNADDAAADVAAAVGAAELLFVSDVEGVRRGADTLARVDADGAAELEACGEASGGMIPKLRAALRASARGVPSVRIGGAEMILSPGAGTTVGEEAPVHAHR